ncbi:Peptidyl-prolyl cis-trans isomerase CYP37, chloroplastic [Cucurbita argyrosperma subsp. argyrosperma]|nr:Peptidyl-prolyl cis-trans isomerase CYP37, chloroplastic [Cucurbita argyrosperma subsp. argyrosperma]
MAFPLSSAVFSRRLSLSVAPHTTRCSFLHTHCIIPFTRSSGSSILPKLSSASAKNSSLRVSVMQESMDQHKFLRKSCISGFEHGKREFGKLIAMILICIQISSPLPLLNWDIQSIHPAMAVLYSPDTKVPRTGELALRRAIPANTSMKAIQDSLEEISYLLRIPQRKPYGTYGG